MRRGGPGRAAQAVPVLSVARGEESGTSASHTDAVRIASRESNGGHRWGLLVLFLPIDPIHRT